MSSFCGEAPQCGNASCPHKDNVNTNAITGTATKLLCKNCLTISYCSRACQIAAWKLHKKPCRQRLTFTLPCTEDYGKNMDAIDVMDSGTALGRIIVAKQKFCTGNTAIVEQPTLSWQAGEGSAMVRAFLGANDVTRGLVLDMFYPPLNSPIGNALREDANKIAHTVLGSDCGADWEARVLTLFLIHSCNSHQFCGEGKGDSQVEPSTETAYTALFSLASKVEHSCFPNLMYNSSTGSLRYLAVRDIKVGEHLSFSYINDDLEQPLQERRAELQRTKYFVCGCQRCMGPDFCRPLPCATSSCDGIALRTPNVFIENDADAVAASGAADQQIGDSGSWLCKTCGETRFDAEMEDALKLESRLMSDVHVMESNPGAVELAVQLQANAEAQLPRAHYIHPRLCDLISILSAREAAAAAVASAEEQQEFEKVNGRDIVGARVHAASATMQNLLWRECMQMTLVASSTSSVCDASESWVRSPPPATAASGVIKSEEDKIDDVFAVWSELGTQLKPVFQSACDAFNASKQLLHAGMEDTAAKVMMRYKDSILEWATMGHHDVELVNNVFACYPEHVFV